MSLADDVVAGFTAFRSEVEDPDGDNPMHRIYPACIDAKPSTKDASKALAGKRKRGDKEGRGAGSSTSAKPGE